LGRQFAFDVSDDQRPKIVNPSGQGLEKSYG